ncbi:MAG: AAA family ATPase [Deltaproteobacteria bacterium]|nr:AAA family ATPase [Deltaproteobacteria bacterium]MBW2639018.1 AAA family ATPase [Deltaproteobacteria bacterium]
MATLKYGVIDQKGFLLVTGDVGTGKTTLVNALLESLQDDTLVANITNPFLSLIDFYNFVAISFNISKKFDNKVDFIVYFSHFLNKVFLDNKNVLLIIDEAHRLSIELLEDIRLLSNIELPEKKLINIFLVGQNEINQTLASQECRALRQRIMLTYQINPLSEIETFEYIKYRLKVAGTEMKLFKRRAVQEVYRFSNGYPRLINKICDHALLTGYVRGLKKITPDIIEECSQELSPPSESKNNTVSNFPYQPSYYEHSPRLVKHSFENQMSMGMETPTNQDARSIPLRQAERTEKRMDSKEYNKGNATKDVKESSIARVRKKLLLWGSAVSSTQKKMVLWGSAVTVAVIVMILTGPSKNGISSKENVQKAATSVLTAPASSPIKTDRNFSSQTLTDRGATPAPPLSISAAHNDKSKTNKPIVLELAKEELNNKNYKRSVELFEDIIALHPLTIQKIKGYYSQALRGQAGSLLGTNPRESERLLVKAIEIDPQNAEAHFDLGKLYTRSKDYSKATKAYQNAADLNYRSVDTFFNLGFIYSEKKDYMNAEKMFLLVTDSRTDYLDKALFNLSVVQQKQGKTNQCIKNLEKALNINPENQRVRTYLNHLKSKL